MSECKKQSCTLQPARCGCAAAKTCAERAHTASARCSMFPTLDPQSPVGLGRLQEGRGGAGHVRERRKCQEKVTTRSANDSCGGMRVDVTHPVGLGKPRQGKHVQEQEPLEQVLHHTSTLQPPKQDLGEPARASLQHPTHPCH